MTKVLVGLFDKFDDAQRVVQELVDAGFDRDDISLVANDARGRFRAETGREGDVDATEGEGMAAGAGIGAAVGGLGGLLVGLGVLAIPGIGPVLAAGPLLAALGGAGIGAAAGGLIGALVEAGVPEERAHQYAEGVRRGGTLVSVRAADERAQAAEDIMNRFNPIDVDERAGKWREDKWERFDPEGRPYTSDDIERANYPFIEELQVDSRRMVEGKGGISGEGRMGTMDFETVEPRFREHYESYYANRGLGYTEYRTAYRYGYDMGGNERYRDRDWNEVERDLRLDWEQSHHQSKWEDFKDAIREGWYSITRNR